MRDRYESGTKSNRLGAGESVNGVIGDTGRRRGDLGGSANERRRRGDLGGSANDKRRCGGGFGNPLQSAVGDRLMQRPPLCFSRTGCGGKTKRQLVPVGCGVLRRIPPRGAPSVCGASSGECKYVESSDELRLLCALYGAACTIAIADAERVLWMGCLEKSSVPISVGELSGESCTPPI